MNGGWSAGSPLPIPLGDHRRGQHRVGKMVDAALTEAGGSSPISSVVPRERRVSARASRPAGARHHYSCDRSRVACQMSVGPSTPLIVSTSLSRRELTRRRVSALIASLPPTS
jgi:hypothetical protein